jgi:hypothetical protein
MAQKRVVVIAHGNWDGASRFTVPPNIMIEYFYQPESGTALCYSESQIPGLCQQEVPHTRRPGEQVPNFYLTSGLPFQCGVRDCASGAYIMSFQDGQTYMLYDLITSLSRMATAAGEGVFVRMLVCGGGKSSILAATGAPAGDLNKLNGLSAYQNALDLGIPPHIARKVQYAIENGASPSEANAYAMRGYGRRRRRKGTKRISRRRRRTVRSR